MDPIAPLLFTVPRHHLLRTLSDREKSKLFLGKTDQGQFVAVKLESPKLPGKTRTILQRYGKLQELTTAEGFTRILDFGELDSGWVWHSLLLADNLPGLTPLASGGEVDLYTPLTLAAWIIEKGPTSSEQVAQWGARIANVLTALHRADLVHRDVKPGNLIFIDGNLCLADYGLVGEPGSEFDLTGTEGFIPLEGTSEPAADLFALGKTLYEAWSGKDRLEFPSLPFTTTEGPDWTRYGKALNEVILRACHAQPTRRFRSAETLSEALTGVTSGNRPVSRRGWIAALGSVTALGTIGLVMYRSRPPARATWRCLRPKGFNVESWQGHRGTADWARGHLYSICRDGSGFTLHTLDLSSFALSTRMIERFPQQTVSSLLHPVSGKLWAVEGGRGEVYEIDVDSGEVRTLGGGPNTAQHYGAKLYWNPVNQRVGSFGGYGQFAVRISRHEFDEAAKAWVEVKPPPGGSQPWPRDSASPMVVGRSKSQLFQVGGYGSMSGVQGEETKGLRWFDGRFHFLDDIWELDLTTNQWKEVLPIGTFPLNPERLRVAMYHPRLKALMILTAFDHRNGDSGSAGAWMVRPGVDKKPIRLPQHGPVSRLPEVWSYAIDPVSHDLLLLVNDGIFSVSFS